MLYGRLSDVLREWRGDRTQEEIARAAGLTQSAVSQIEAGHARPRADTLARLCQALGRTEAELAAQIAREVA